jgi:hypothetical protein
MRSWHAVGLFCEDIRQERNGQSLMAIWPDNLHVPAVPSTLPRIAVFIRIHVDPLADVGSISAVLRLFDGSENSIGGFTEENVKDTQKVSRDSDLPWAGFMLSAVAFGFPINSTGKLFLIVRVGDEEVVCGTLNIVSSNAATSSAASVQPE